MKSKRKVYGDIIDELLKQRKAAAKQLDRIDRRIRWYFEQVKALREAEK